MARWFLFAATLFFLPCGASAQLTSCPNGWFDALEVFAPVAKRINSQSGPKALLPRCVDVETDVLFTNVLKSDKHGYKVVLGFDPACEGQNVCGIGIFEASRQDRPNLRGKRVKLAGGRTAYFHQNRPGFYIPMARLAWFEGGILYRIHYKGTQADLRKLADFSHRVKWTDAVAPLEEQTFFYSEDPVRKRAQLPESVVEQIARDESVIAALKEEALSEIPPEWLEASELQLNQDSRPDLVVIGRGPLDVARLTTFWLFLADQDGYRQVLRIRDDDLLVNGIFLNGFRRVRTILESSGLMAATIYEFKDGTYRPVTANEDEEQQLRFSAEDDGVQRPVPLPDEIFAFLSKQSFVRDVTESSGEKPARSWFAASHVHLDQDGKPDLVVVARGPLRGANVTTYWLFLNIGSGYKLVFEDAAHTLTLSPQFTRGFREVLGMAATATKATIVQFEFRNGKYVRSGSECTRN